MAYTSTFFGMRVDSHPAYLTLLDRFDDGSFPHLGRTLQEMGYFHGRVTALPAQVSDEQWQQYQRFFNTDRWLRYEDLAYQGPHFGWGPAPPDQFVLGEANDLLQAAAGSQPLLLFLITQNSHYPWQEIPQLVTDRRTLNDGSGKDVQPNLQTPRVDVSLDDYMAAITYELRFLSRFIAEDAHDQAIFILVGDHQPGYITRKADGYQTPLHIISKDQALLDKVAAYGFQPGMLASDALARMKHEGFYSLFMRALLERYGRGDRLPPPYLPQGLPLWPAQAADQQTGS